MNKRKSTVFFSDKLNDCVVNHGYIERLRKTHLNKDMPKFLTIDLEDYQENNNRILLMMRQEGFDVVMIENHNVSFSKFIKDYDTALAYFNDLKQQKFNTKEELISNGIISDNIRKPQHC